MSSRSTGSVRMGPISLFALIILISLAVLAVLAVATAEASYAAATKQEHFTTDTYTNEVAGQELLAKLDDKLADLRAENAKREEAIETLRTSLPNEAWLDGETIYAQIRQESGRMLNIAVEINSNLEYEVVQWEARTQWSNSEEGITLWSNES